MKIHKEIRWSEVVRRTITEYIEKLEEKGSETTTKDLLEELGDDFRKSLNELSFEKAAKEYKKMKDAEWKRVSMIRTA
jgi:deoxyhypusine synthase